MRELIANPAKLAPTFDLSRLLHDVLPSWDEPWLNQERNVFRQLRLHGLLAVADFWLRSGKWALAIEAAQLAAPIDPLAEPAHFLLAAAHLV